MKHNTIKLNGKLYDAVTGKLVTTSNNGQASLQNTAKPKLKTAPSKPANSPNNLIDGFKRPSKSTNRAKQASRINKPKSPQTSTSKSTKSKESKPSTPTNKPKTARSNAKSATSHLQRTSTLRRNIVKKPTVANKTKLRAMAPKATSNNQPSNTANNKQGTARPIKSDIQRSPMITKFNNKQATTTPVKSPVNKKPAIANKTKSSTPAKPAKHGDVKVSAKEALIAKKFAELDAQRAMDKKTNTKKKHKLKFTTVVASGLVVVLASLYVVYLNVPNIALKVAAKRAGFTAALPHYLPSGYSLNGPIQYKPGQITIDFKSNSDNRSYSLTQQPTQWDSEAVYDNYVSKQSNKPPYTIQDSGLTIYIFGDNNAAWVNGGKFFAINSNSAKLSIEQLQHIATSL